MEPRINLRFVRIAPLIRQMNRIDQLQFACDCAERVIPIYQSDYPEIGDPLDWLSVARQYISGEADRVALDETNDHVHSIAVDVLDLWHNSVAPSDYALWSIWDAVFVAGFAFDPVHYYTEARTGRVARHARRAAGGAEQLWQRRQALNILARTP